MWNEYFDPKFRELDLFSLGALIFLPAIGALVTLLIPGRFREAIRWLALFTTGGTLCLAFCTVVDYHRVLEFQSDRSVRSLYHPLTRLDARIERQQIERAKPIPGGFRSDDLVVIRPWIDRFDIHFTLGVDGINLMLVVLSALVLFFAAIASWTIEKHLKGYLALLLLLETGVIGAFLSMDLFLFYVFYELMLLPMYFLIGIWGGPRRKLAAMKFVLYTLVGSIGLLGGIIALGTINVRDFVDQNVVISRKLALEKADPTRGLTPAESDQVVSIQTFDVTTLGRVGRAALLVLRGEEHRIGVRGDPDNQKVALFAAGVDRTAALARFKASPVCQPWFQYLVFGLLFIGFAVKVPIVPLHSWLPDAHVEAPTPVSMVLAGVLLKLGGYGLVRFAYPFCPWAAQELSFAVGFIGVLSILYGGLIALAQSDFKKLLAYSSVSHMGFVLLGLSAINPAASISSWEWGVNGALFQMIAHGITATALFFVVGIVYERAHHRELSLLGGLTEPMPVYSALAGILMFASMALPGLCGFVGEVMVFMGAWGAQPGLTAAAVLSVILTAAYLLRAWSQAFLGINPNTASFPDVNAREIAVLLPSVILAFALGIVPGLLVFQWLEPSVFAWVEPLAQLRPTP
ncbi:MAG: complex I subunit 4 family protein [Gemmataceae bacterium]